MRAWEEIMLYVSLLPNMKSGGGRKIYVYACHCASAYIKGRGRRGELYIV